MLASIVNLNKPKRLTGLSQKARSRFGRSDLARREHDDCRCTRADLNHPVNITEHGNAANLVWFRTRTDLTARRVRRRSFGRTEKAKASGNALDTPTSVWSILARELAEPS